MMEHVKERPFLEMDPMFGTHQMENGKLPYQQGQQGQQQGYPNYPNPSDFNKVWFQNFRILGKILMWITHKVKLSTKGEKGGGQNVHIVYEWSLKRTAMTTAKISKLS